MTPIRLVELFAGNSICIEPMKLLFESIYEV